MVTTIPVARLCRNAPPSPVCTVSEPDLTRLPSIQKPSVAEGSARRRNSAFDGLAHELPHIRIPCSPVTPSLKSTTTAGSRRVHQLPTPSQSPSTCCHSPGTPKDATTGTKVRVRFERSALIHKSTSRFVKGSSRLNSKLNQHLFEGKIVQQKEVNSHLQAFADMRIGRDGTVSMEDFIRHIEKRAPALLEHARSLYSRLTPGGQTLSFRNLMHGLYPAATHSDVDALTRIAMNRHRPIASPPVCGQPSKRDIKYATDVYHYWNKSGTGSLTYSECEAALIDAGLLDSEIDAALDEMFTDEFSTVSLRYFVSWFSACM